jgi:hypothetical protein
MGGMGGLSTNHPMAIGGGLEDKKKTIGFGFCELPNHSQRSQDGFGHPMADMGVAKTITLMVLRGGSATPKTKPNFFFYFLVGFMGVAHGHGVVCPPPFTPPLCFILG